MYNRTFLTIVAIAIGVYSGLSTAAAQETPVAADVLVLTTVPDFVDDAPPTLTAIDALPVDQLWTAVPPEATEEAPVAVTINIDNAAPAVTPTPPSEPATDGNVTMNVWQIVIGVGGLLITGMAAGGFGVLAFLRGVNQNPALMASIEALANSRPDRERTVAHEIGGVLKEAGAAIEEATDNIPLESKTTTVTAPAGSTLVITPPLPSAVVQGPVSPVGPQAPTAAEADVIAAQRQQSADVTPTTGSVG